METWPDAVGRTVQARYRWLLNKYATVAIPYMADNPLSKDGIYDFDESLGDCLQKNLQDGSSQSDHLMQALLFGRSISDWNPLAYVLSASGAIGHETVPPAEFSVNGQRIFGEVPAQQAVGGMLNFSAQWDFAKAVVHDIAGDNNARDLEIQSIMASRSLPFGGSSSEDLLMFVRGMTFGNWVSLHGSEPAANAAPWLRRNLLRIEKRPGS